MPEKLERTLSLRVSDADMERLEAAATRWPIATARTLARVAMRIGLDAIEKDPTLLLATPIERRGGARPRKAKSKKASPKTTQRRKR